jgi:hypothetical protein
MPELEQVLSALASAYWNMDYKEFLQRTGFVDSEYACAKFKLFQQSVKGLIEFDTKTIESLLVVNHK